MRVWTYLWLDSFWTVFCHLIQFLRWCGGFFGWSAIISLLPFLGWLLLLKRLSIWSQVQMSWIWPLLSVSSRIYWAGNTWFLHWKCVAIFYPSLVWLLGAVVWCMSMLLDATSVLAGLSADVMGLTWFECKQVKLWAIWGLGVTAWGNSRLVD